MIRVATRAEVSPCCRPTAGAGKRKSALAVELLATVRISSLQARLSRQPQPAHFQKTQEISMKKLLRCLMAMSFLAISSAAISQPSYARQEQQQDQMKKDEMKKDEMKKDEMKKGKKGKKAKKDQMKKDEMKKDEMKKEEMKKEGSGPNN
jgi:pentapeptide MXKDX repeat protein